MKDEVFNEELIKQFEFDEKVVRVFDDMVTRSVPYYLQNQELIFKILSQILPKNAKVLDLGCSTANTLLALSKRDDLELFGLDNSEQMLNRARIKASDLGVKINLINKNIEDILSLNDSFDAIICSYTLHFIRPLLREDLLQKIYKLLNKNGIFILCEKVLYENKILQKNIIDIYENYKELQGYSRYEIAQKRAALENVLIPFTYDENIKILSNANFEQIDCFFRWANFCSFIAFKL
ncbi:carboxy-S-adenosyl-L-methionine synthase CmoA [Campylobacter sp. 2018MI01]|uniref:carboxy-S-adenosyl-L-methionine synthase CmoA n=1 Tax=Campylobacter sp. 2018MI01 TaxID=2836735 RepID=UPI001BDA096F|nr:carboxy-S-adenosyl-L-methionine synthase CmoA [Campylobacter sp. 2018MI01]MBT0878393.1 carboxy-S-adenosyl-L-methionine synthase CmoA [Campylobacter sp. 2018MI01]